MRITTGIVAATLLFAGAALAVDDPDNLMQGTVSIIKTGKLAKFVAKPGAISPLPSDANAPTTGGGSLQIFDTGKAGNEDTYALPASGWSRIPKKVKPGNLKGYKFKGDTCKTVIVKATSVKGVCKGGAVGLTTPFTGNVGIVLTVGPDSKRYCASFGGTGKNDTKQVNRKGAPTPSACPIPAGVTTTTLAQSSTTSTLSGTTSTTSTTVSGPSTTSTSETSTTVTSTTTNTEPTTTSTTVPGGGCCNGAGFISVLTKDESGDCGDIIDSAGMSVNLACAGLYTGGGGNSVPLPFTVPDLGQAVSSITSCTGQTATLGGTTSAETGSNRNCTSTGCLFGAPLAVPNPGSTPTSVCVLNAASAGVTGTATCDSGATTVNLPLTSVIFLTGDTGGDPMSTITGIQPCPLCAGGNPGTCSAGPNSGLSCIPGTSDLGGDAAYPTSHDCPPDPMTNIGSLPISFSLTTGSVTWTGTAATNDTGSTSSTQNRVFAGFCRDTNGTGAFQQPFQQCWENGMAVGAACAEPNESCEQRGNGAFGPNGGSIKTILAIGAGSSLLGGPVDGFLVSVFSIPPTFDATVDAAGDLPGPGAVALPGTASLCANAMCN